MSSLKLNSEKTEIHTAGIFGDHLAAILDIYGFKRDQLPVNYLGVPLTPSKLTENDCKPLMHKIVQGVSSWISKHLPFTGRFQLVSFVGQIIANYRCNDFILPKNIIKGIESKGIFFLWKGKATSTKSARVA